MNSPARRDGTPDKKPSRGPVSGRRGAVSRRRGAATSTTKKAGKPSAKRSAQNSSRAKTTGANTTGRPQPRNKAFDPTERFVSQAKPAKRQHVTPQQTEQALGAQKNSDIRLQKVLAAAGVASRRMSEKLIAAGRVEVNGEIVQQMGLRIDPNKDIVRVDGTRVQVNQDMEYFVLNKPAGVHSTMQDELGRPCVGDLIGTRLQEGQGLFHVGRLDAATEGLLLLTNDGELANRLMHPSYEISKTYMATVLGEVKRDIIRQLKEGVDLDDGIARADNVQIIDVWQGKSLIKVELHEGRKHIVRRMLKELGFPVQRLVRTKIHTVQLGEQKPGSVRALNSAELTSLYKAVDL